MRVDKNGYILTSSGKPFHRKVYFKNYGTIPVGWHVHHIDYVKTNNHPDNLIALPPNVHIYIHKNNIRNRDDCELHLSVAK